MTALAVPGLHRFVVGVVDCDAPLCIAPQTPENLKGTEQAVGEVFVPPFAPLQPQVKFQGDAIGVATPVGVPLEHRLAVGAVDTGVELLAEPHAPLDG